MYSNGRSISNLVTSNITASASIVEFLVRVLSIVSKIHPQTILSRLFTAAQLCSLHASTMTKNGRESTLLCLALLVVLGLAMPVPPKIIAYTKHSPAVKEDTSNNVGGAGVDLADHEVVQGIQDTFVDRLVTELMQKLQNTLLDVFPCEDYCTSTYPTHTYPVVENHLACKQGCKFAELNTIISKLVSHKCKLDCSNFYQSDEERFACSVGCNVPNTTTTKRTTSYQDLSLVAVEQTLTSHVEHRSQSLKNLFKRLFNGDDSPVANRRGTQGLDVANLKIQLQSEYIVVSSGPDVWVMAEYSYNDGSQMLLAEELKIKTLLQKASKYTSFYNPTLLFTSTSVCTVYHKLLINKLLVFAMVLLVVMVLLLLLSLNNDVKKAREIKNALKEDTLKMKFPLYVPTQESEFIQKEAPLMPVTVQL